MATITVRDLPDHVRHALKVRAADRGHSMEAEVRQILTDAVAPARNLGQVWLDDVKGLEGDELEFPSRASKRPDVDFS